jgi:hypothetical protein
MFPKTKKNPWSIEETTILVEMCNKRASHKAIAKKLGRPFASVKEKIRRLGLKTRRWPTHEVERLKMLWLNGQHSIRTIGRFLKRSPAACLTKAQELGLKTGAPADSMSVKALSKKMGFSMKGMNNIIKQAELVPVPILSVNAGKKHRLYHHRYYNTFQVQIAVEKWLAK